MTDNKKNEKLYMDIPKSKFAFANVDKNIHDIKFDTKPVSSLKDAMNRFTKNKSSVVSFFIILLLFLYAIFVPIIAKNSYNTNTNDNLQLEYKNLLPKTKMFSWLGWDGAKYHDLNPSNFLQKLAVGAETGMSPVLKYERNENENGEVSYRTYVDSYYDMGLLFVNLTKEEYDSLQRWQDKNNIQVIYPACDYSKLTGNARKTAENNASYYYMMSNTLRPTYQIVDGEYVFENIYRLSDGRDNYTSLRLEGNDEEQYQYAIIGGTAEYDSNGNIQFDEDGYIIGSISYRVRVSKFTYFQFKYGMEPVFTFGTNDLGQDIFYRLANGARFSFLLAIFVSLINLTIGAIYGAIEGYYGGTADIIMERLTEILGGIPFIVVTTLFQLHLAKHVGVVGALLFAFIATGWIGMASTVRMQFYRFKNHEYILAARTLGAKDGRIMFKHIFPNALGTIITSCVLVIPGVIFTESSLTYLGIINLESGRWTSVGTMLALGRDSLQNFPHIIMFPALFISLLEISFNLFGNGLRDAFNPSLRGSEG